MSQDSNRPLLASDHLAAGEDGVRGVFTPDSQISLRNGLLGIRTRVGVERSGQLGPRTIARLGVRRGRMDWEVKQRVGDRGAGGQEQERSGVRRDDTKNVRQ